MTEEFNPSDYYPKDWPKNPFHDGEVQLQKKAGVHEHIMTYAFNKFKPYMPKTHREFYATLPFLIVSAIDGDGLLWSTLLFANNAEENAINFVQSPDPVTLEIHGKPLKGDALENAFREGSDLSILGMDWGRCMRNKVNGRVTSREDSTVSFRVDQSGGVTSRQESKISFRVDQSFPHCPKYITPHKWSVAPVNTQGVSPSVSTSLSQEQARCIDTAEAMFIATCYRGEGEDPRYGNDVNYRGGPAGFMRREGMNKLFIPEFAGNHHFNTIGNLVLDDRISVVIPLFDTREMIQLSGTAVIEENFQGSNIEGPGGTSIIAESTIVFTIEKVVHLPAGSLPVQFEAATKVASSDDSIEVPSNLSKKNNCASGQCMKQVSTLTMDSTTTTEDDDSVSTASGGKPQVLILYGSETGNSEAIARQLKGKLDLLDPILMSLDEAAGFDVVQAKGITHILCACSTFNIGSPPENAKKFFKLGIPKLKGVQYAVLALGSSMYPDFCKAGKALDKKLSKAGLKRLCSVVTIDEAAVGSDSEIESWMCLIKGWILPRSLESDLNSSRHSFDSSRHSIKWSIPPEITADINKATSTKGSRCIKNEELAINSSRSIREISFEAPGPYTTGDHLAVQPLNSEDKVQRFLSCFEWELLEAAKKSSNCTIESDNQKGLFEWQIDQSFKIERTEDGNEIADINTSLYDLARKDLDFAINHSNARQLMDTMKIAVDRAVENTRQWKESLFYDPLLQEFFGYCNPILDSSKKEAHEIDGLVAKFPTVIHLLERYKSLFLEPVCGDPIMELAEILVILGHLKPRYYSISSSNRVDPERITITVGILQETSSENVLIEGVCSNYLKSLQPDIDDAEVAVAPSTFRLPESLSAPIIMVGAGTGLAPLVGFLEDRELDAQSESIGDITLFFGCRTEDDFIYEERLRSANKRGIIDLHLALSRSKSMPKKYVQDLIADEGEGIADLLMNPETHYYVCGDARMADGCYEACIAALQEHRKMSRTDAVSHLNRKMAEGSWQTDVWGSVSHSEDSRKVIEETKKKNWLVKVLKSYRRSVKKARAASKRDLFGSYRNLDIIQHDEYSENLVEDTKKKSGKKWRLPNRKSFHETSWRTRRSMRQFVP